jgi:prophage lp2 protein 26
MNIEDFAKEKRWNVMENRFLSRGKQIDNGEWIQGYLYGIWERRYILWGMTNDIPNMVEVDPETVCQCTAMPDKNSKLIFENDIVIKHNDDDKEPYLIRWSENYAAWELAQCGCAMYGFFDVDFGEIEVIGNAIDNPELLEV